MDKRLLIFDDDQAVARIIGVIAEKEGFLVQYCAGPDEFFHAMTTWHPTHTIIDLVMPAMDGVEALRTLAKIGCPSRIIVTSGIGDKTLEMALRTASSRGLTMVGVLPKPFKAQDLRDLLSLPNTTASERSAPGEKALGLTPDDVEQALRADQFLLHYQPKIDLRSGMVSGLEALIRWQHPRYGLVYPDYFIPLAERTGQIEPITWRMIEIALHWFKASCGSASPTLCLNLSIESLKDILLADHLAQQCAEHGIAHDCLVLELTETSALKDAREAMDILTRLRIKGFSLSIDDFGTGYSSMTYLAELPFSELKIDKSFVMRMATSIESRKIVESTVMLAHSLGLVTVAEGVEDSTVMKMLQDAGCDMAQGYHVAKPMPPQLMKNWLREYRP